MRRVIQYKALFLYVFLLLVLQFVAVKAAQTHAGVVLSYASNINVNDLLNDTNAKRVANKLSVLKLDPELSQAAEKKGENMFAEQYWAHTSPSGKDPWGFINSAGYHYIYAGENLARDFADSAGVVEAWMNSPSHRENLLNNRYQDVGFAVLNGKYGSYETTLVVQEFGSRASGIPTVQAEGTGNVAVAIPTPAAPTPTAQPAITATPVSQNTTPVLSPAVVVGVPSNLPLNIFQITKLISLLLTGFLVITLIFDGITTFWFKTAGVTGHNTAHLLFFTGLIITLIILQRGLVI